MTLTPTQVDLAIRPAEERDVEAIQRVAREAWEATARSVLGAADRRELVGHLYERRTLLEDVGRHSSLFLVATLQDAVVGFAEFVYEGRAGEVARVAVRPDWQRRGVATALLRCGLAAFAGRDVKVMTAAVEPEDEACRLLFEHNGFDAVTQPPDDLEDLGGELSEFRRRLDAGLRLVEGCAGATVWIDDARRICPRCHRHYHEALETCRHCGVTLVAEAPGRRDARSEPAPRFTTLVASSDESRLAFVQSALEGAGIRFSVRRELENGEGEVVAIRVAGAQLAEAREVLDALETEEVAAGAEE